MARLDSAYDFLLVFHSNIWPITQLCNKTRAQAYKIYVLYTVMVQFSRFIKKINLNKFRCTFHEKINLNKFRCPKQYLCADHWGKNQEEFEIICTWFGRSSVLIYLLQYCPMITLNVHNLKASFWWIASFPQNLALILTPLAEKPRLYGRRRPWQFMYVCSSSDMQSRAKIDYPGTNSNGYSICSE